MPCHEFYGLGHSQMWAVRVVPENAVKPGPHGRAACATRWMPGAGSPMGRLCGFRDCRSAWRLADVSEKPPAPPYVTAQSSFRTVTAQGVRKAYDLTTLMVMGFGYLVAETALGTLGPPRG